MSRSIARDLGEALGCHGHVRELRRIWSGPFEAEDGLSIEQIDEMAKTTALDEYLHPLETGLSDLPELKCTPEGATRLPPMVTRHGVGPQMLNTETRHGPHWMARPLP